MQSKIEKLPNRMIVSTGPFQTHFGSAKSAAEQIATLHQILINYIQAAAECHDLMARVVVAFDAARDPDTDDYCPCDELYWQRFMGDGSIEPLREYLATIDPSQRLPKDRCMQQERKSNIIIP